MEEELESTDLSAPEPPKEITLETMGFFNDAGKGPPSPIKWTKAEPMEPEVPHLQLQQNLPAIGNMSALARILQEHREAADEQAAYEAINDTLTKMQVFDPVRLWDPAGMRLLVLQHLHAHLMHLPTTTQSQVTCTLGVCAALRAVHVMDYHYFSLNVGRSFGCTLSHAEPNGSCCW